MNKNLGCMNGWEINPIEYTNCVKQQHPLIIINIGLCYNKYVCEICNIEYTVDSSG